MNHSNTWYFAYGSNLNTGQMTTRIGEWTGSKRAVAKGYKLAFNVQSRRWGGLAANLVRTNNADDRVYGAIYRIRKQKLDVFTRYEGAEPTDVEVEADGVQIMAKAYIFETSKDSGRPPAAYLEVIFAGLRQHGYPEEVIERLKELAEFHQQH